MSNEYSSVDSEVLAISDLLSSCNIDVNSECDIAVMVDNLNDCIHKLMINIMDASKKSGLILRKYPVYPNDDLEKPGLIHYLTDPNLSEGSRTMTARFIFLDEIFSAIHTHFFEGRNFFGAGSGSLKDISELLFSKLEAHSTSPPLRLKIIPFFFLKKKMYSENFDATTIHHWKCMTVHVIFQTNENVFRELYGTLSQCLFSILHILFKTESSNFESILSSEQDNLKSAILHARKLSYNIQQTVSGQLLVTSAAEVPGVLGTCGFGLQRIIGTKSVALRGPKTITFESLLNC
jgi:hypothetical protein